MEIGKLRVASELVQLRHTGQKLGLAPAAASCGFFGVAHLRAGQLLGSNVGAYFSQAQLMVVLGPEHAETIAGDGLSREDVQRFVYENARLPLGLLKLGGMYGMHDWPAWMNAIRDEAARPPRVPSPDDVFVLVAGGSGKHSAVVPNCCFSRAITRRVTRWPR